MGTRALLVGINHYYSMGSLSGPSTDVVDFKAWLVTIGVTHVDDLTSPGAQDVYTATPVATQINDWLNLLERDAKKRPETEHFPLGERVYIFFAGHGYDADTAGPCGVFPRSRTEYWDVFPFQPLERMLKNLAYFKEVVVVIDACREVINYAADPSWQYKAKPRPGSDQVKVFSIYASSAGQKTQEKRFPDGKIKGVLTQAFLQGVAGLASNTAGNVVTDDLKNYMINAVQSLIPAADPRIELPLGTVFSRAPKKSPLLEFKCTVPGGVTVLLKKDTGGELTIKLSEGITQFQVELGSYRLVLPDATERNVNAIWEVNSVEI